MLFVYCLEKERVGKINKMRPRSVLHHSPLQVLTRKSDLVPTRQNKVKVRRNVKKGRNLLIMKRELFSVQRYKIKISKS